MGREFILKELSTNKKTVLWLAIALLVGLIAYAQQFDSESDFEYERIDNNRAICITGYIGNRAVVNIPSRIQGLPVTTIGSYAFYQNRNLTNVTIPNNVTSIESFAFDETSLANVTIGNSITSIGWMAFMRSLTSIHVASGNLHYSSLDGVLYDREQRTLVKYPSGRAGATFTIPSGVTSIGDRAFYDTGLTSVTIPNSVASIGMQAFSFTRLNNITIPNSVTFIDELAFADTGLTSVTFVRSGITIKEIGVWHGGGGDDGDTFPGDLRYKYLIGGAGTYTRTEGEQVWVRPQDREGDFYFLRVDSGRSVSVIKYTGTQQTVQIPQQIQRLPVTSIGGLAFANSDIGSITIPNSITSIGNYAFYGCTSLTSVTIGNSVTSIGYAAFYGCTSLTSVTIGNSVSSIGDSAFSGCRNLTNITIPNSVTSIGDWAFAGTGLTNITIPNSVTSIGGNAFWESPLLPDVRETLIRRYGESIFDAAW